MSRISLYEIDNEGRAISWEGDLNAIMREAFHLIAERVHSCGSIEESMKLLIKHLDGDLIRQSIEAYNDESYRYAFSIDERPPALGGGE